MDCSPWWRSDLHYMLETCDFVRGNEWGRYAKKNIYTGWAWFKTQVLLVWDSSIIPRPAGWHDVKVKLCAEGNHIFQRHWPEWRVKFIVMCWIHNTNIEWTVRVLLWCVLLWALIAIVDHSVWFLLNRDKLNNLCRQKEKLEEKIMEHYRKLDSCSTKKWVPSLCVMCQSTIFRCTWKILNLGFVYIFPAIAILGILSKCILYKKE